MRKKIPRRLAFGIGIQMLLKTMQNLSNNINKQLVKYNKWLPNNNHDIFVQCIVKEPHIECKLSIPLPENNQYSMAGVEQILAAISLITLIMVICIFRKK